MGGKGDRIDGTAVKTDGRAYPYVVLAVLLLVYVLNYLDRQLVSLLAEPIKADLGLTDTQLGLVTGFMFALFYTTFGLPVAWLADRSNRVRIVAVACGLWSLFTAVCGLAGNFVHLALARMGVGVGEAGGVPPSYAILSDYFPPRRRGLAIGLYSLGIPLGTMAGGAYGSWAAEHFGWRMAFVGLAIPGVILGLLLPLLVREPQRGKLDAAAPAAAGVDSLLATLKDFLKSLPMVLVTMGCALSAVVGFSLMSWSPAFLMRVQGATLHDIGAYYSPLIGLTVGLGIFGSGWLADRFGAKSRAWYPLVPAIAFILAYPLYLAAVSAPDWRMTMLLICIPQGLTFTYLAPAVAAIQNLAPPGRRSTASALLLFVLNLLAVGCGPVFVGAVSDWAEPRYGVGSLRIALLALQPFFLLGVGANLWAAWTLRQRHRSAETA